MDNKVIEKYEQQKDLLQRQLQNLIYNLNVSQLGHYNMDIELTRNSIKDVTNIIDIYKQLIDKISNLNTYLFQIDRDRIIADINYEKRKLPIDLIEVLDEKLIKTIDEGNSFSDYEKRRLELQKQAHDSINTVKLGMGVNIPDEQISKELKEVNEITETYKKVIMNLVKLRKIHEINPENQEEIERLSIEIKKDKEKLPSKMLREIEQHFNEINDFDNEKELAKGVEHEIEEPIEVVSVKKHKINKRKVLIALGLSAIAASVVMEYQTLIDVNNNIIVQNLANIMQENSDLWHNATSVVKERLHESNIALADAINKIGGKEPMFNDITGLWSFDGNSITDIIKNNKIINTMKSVGTGITGGIGVASLTSGLRTKTKEQLVNYKDYFHKYKKMVSDNVSNIKDKATSFISEVSENTQLNKEQKTGLLIKAKKLIGLSKEKKESTYQKYVTLILQLKEQFKLNEIGNEEIKLLEEKIENDDKLKKYEKKILLSKLATKPKDFCDTKEEYETKVDSDLELTQDNNSNSEFLKFYNLIKVVKKTDFNSMIFVTGIEDLKDEIFSNKELTIDEKYKLLKFLEQKFNSLNNENTTGGRIR